MPNGGSLTVSSEMSSNRDHVRIRVRDTGIGIPKFLQSSIWEPFVTAKESESGVGLGLSVVYGVVTQHGGSVDMQSEQTKGTVFTVTFPIFTKDKEHEAS
jgi:two-component system, NtrC family, sensor kinase